MQASIPIPATTAKYRICKSVATVPGGPMKATYVRTFVAPTPKRQLDMTRARAGRPRGWCLA
jgi:hypothetical protein